MMGEVGRASCRLLWAGGTLRRCTHLGGCWSQHPSGAGDPNPASLRAPISTRLELPPPLHQTVSPCLLACMSIKPGWIVLPTKELFIFLYAQMAGKILAELSKKERAIQFIFPLWQQRCNYIQTRLFTQRL